jgi:tetratricopeptide (TPR) repeat protein
MKPPFKNIPPSDNAPNNQAGAQVQARFQEALTLHREGHLDQACRHYQQVLHMQPGHFDTLHMLGVIAYQTKNSYRAIDLISRAIEINPNLYIAFNNRGTILNALKQHNVALLNYDQAIALKPDFAEAYNNRGNTLKEIKQFDAALQSYDQAIALKPGYALAYYNRGNTLKEIKQFDAALQSYDQAIAIKPDYAEAYNNRGNILHELMQFDAALQNYNQAISIKPDYTEAYINRGNILQDLKQFHVALQNYDQAIALNPDYAEVYSNRGNTLNNLKQFHAALQSYEKAISIKPDFAEAYNNRGNVLKDLKLFDAALQSYDQAIAIRPDFAEAYNNRGNVLKDLKLFDAALQSYEKAIAIRPGYGKAHGNLSLCHLEMGNFDKGWEKYEWRWESNETKGDLRKFAQPLWVGAESLHGKSILLHSEQGTGDTLQFCRYAKLVADLGAHVILEVQEYLFSLLANIEGVAVLVSKGSTLPSFDFHCPLLSLPLAFKTDIDSIPVCERYIKSDAGRVAEWQTKLGIIIKPRVGLAWSGSTRHKNDVNRSIPLCDFVKLLPSEYNYLSLQKEVRDADTETLKSHPEILHFGEELKDFADTAALCELVDIIVSVDTSVAHLAGALGKPVWILLPFNPDWRWLRDRNDSPWYPTARLYRQDRVDDWEGVYARVKADLRKALYEIKSFP